MGTKPTVTQKRLETLQRVVEKRLSDVVLVLEDIHDPHNAAAILRSCDAFGIQHVYFIFDKTRAYNPRRVGKSSSSSANKWLTFHIFSDVKSCFDELRAHGFSIVATALDEKATSIYSLSVPTQKIALVVGNEHTGISADALGMCDKTVYIPMRGFVQSLNVSVCAAICLFEIARQKKDSLTSSLSPSEQSLLLEDFLGR